MLLTLAQAALAQGLKGEAQFDVAGDAVRVTLEPTQAQTTPLFTAIPTRQCTRGDYDGMLIPQIGEAAWMRSAGRKAYFVGHIKKLRYEFSA